MGVGAGLYVYDVVVKKFTFAISSPDEFLASIQPFSYNGHGPKIWGGCVPFLGVRGELSPHLTQCGRDRGLPGCTSMRRFILIHPIVWHVTDRQDRQVDGPIA